MLTIGLTYDLREDYLNKGFSKDETAEFDRIDTIEAIEDSLHMIGFKTVRIGNVQDLARKLVEGERWDFVFNICEGLFGFGRESQVPCLLDAYKIPYTFSDPMVLALSLHKGMTKRVVQHAGIATPDFAIIENMSQIENINLPFPLFAKPVAEGTGKGITASSKINTYPELVMICENLLRKYNQPVLVETFLSGREFTVSILGTGAAAYAIGTIEIMLLEKADAEVYSYDNKANYEELVEYRLINDKDSAAAVALALDAWRVLGCRDAGRVDIRLDKNGVANFIEVNPLAGLNPVHSDLPITCSHAGISYLELIKEIMRSALVRLPDSSDCSVNISLSNFIKSPFSQFSMDKSASK